MTPIPRTDADSSLIVFAISLFAWKPYDAIEHRAFVTFGGTEKDAREEGLKEALRVWPEADGWQQHHVEVQEVEILTKIVNETIETITPEETANPEFVM